MNETNGASTKITFEEYLICDSECGYVEWVDGEIVKLPNPSLRHQETIGFLFCLLTAHNATHDLGQLVQVPFAMKLETIRRGRVPDLLFVAQKRIGLFAENYLAGAADLIVEVTSPDTRNTDRGEKYFEYEVSGVKEYWLIDPERQHAEFYQLGKDKLYHIMSLEEGNVFRSEVISGFWFRVDWLWNKPNELDALRELGLA